MKNKEIVFKCQWPKTESGDDIPGVPIEFRYVEDLEKILSGIGFDVLLMRDCIKKDPEKEQNQQFKGLLRQHQHFMQKCERAIIKINEIISSTVNQKSK